MMTNLHSALMAFLFGLFLPWVPYILNLLNSGSFDPFKNGIAAAIFYDPIKYHKYGLSVVNPHSQWHLMFGYDKKTLKDLEIPMFLYLSWAFFINLLVILSSRTNNKIGSHKKHLLQFLLINQINCYIGNPKA